MRTALWLLPLMLVGFAFQPAPLPDVTPTDCGDPDEVVPDFLLMDLNPNSATYNTLRSRDEFLGKVFVVYWATAT